MDQPPRQPAVLVVEDDSAVRTMLNLALELHGFQVLLAANGLEAVDLYHQWQEAIALVLTDVQMPDLDGPSTLAALQRLNPEVRCCFMSGHTGKYSAGQLLAMGAAHVLYKPFSSLHELAQTLKDVARDRR